MPTAVGSNRAVPSFDPADPPEDLIRWVEVLLPSEEPPAWLRPDDETHRVAINGYASMRPLYVATAFGAATMVFWLLREDDSPFRLVEPAPEEEALVELLIRARVALVMDFLRVDEEPASLDQADVLLLFAGYHLPLGATVRPQFQFVWKVYTGRAGLTVRYDQQLALHRWVLWPIVADIAREHAVESGRDRDFEARLQAPDGVGDAASAMSWSYGAGLQQGASAEYASDAFGRASSAVAGRIGSTLGEP
jgi:hypothetical protein